MNIYCTGCEKDVQARLTNGQELYPHRKDLYRLPFWVCDDCGAFVGCHHKTAKPTRPLGSLATPEIKEMRKKIHDVIDMLWKKGHMSRGQVYTYITKRIGKTYHSGDIASLDEARDVYKIACGLQHSVLDKK